MAGALLFMGDYYGTLAMARGLGRDGVHVTLADHRRLVRAHGSWHVKTRVRSPPPREVPEFVAWLSGFARQHRGIAAFPASDETAWILARHGAELAPELVTYAPRAEVIETILDKKRLYAACAAAGLAVPRTWAPVGEAELERVADEMTFPVLLKPRTQILLVSGSKGGRVETRGELTRAFAAFERENAFGAPVTDALGDDLRWPLVQEYREAAARSIYSLAGFIDDTGEHAVMRASVKVLQRPRRLGIGLCFEGADVDPELAAKVTNLAKRLGYFGAFEAELVPSEGGRDMALIDFNPRPYSQMAFEVARGLPTPRLLWLGAHGERERLADEVRAARAWRPRGLHVYTHESLLRLVIVGQRLGRLAGASDEHWDLWLRDNRARLTDAVRDERDPLPAVIDALEHARYFVRHPRSFLRSLV